MNNTTQFSVSPRAEKFLRTLTERPGLEMGLVLAYGFENKDADGRITDQYSSTHFYIGWDESDNWSGKRVALADSKFWNSDDVAEALDGRTLTIVEREAEEKELLAAV